LRHAALLGCAIHRLWLIFNTARPQPGQSLAVFGAGGIGLCAIAAAAIAGCTPIIAVDVLPGKLALAGQLGATHGLNAAEGNPVAEIQRLCPGGVDVAIEATGRPAVMAQALQAVRAQGGIAAIAGNAHYGETLAIDPAQLNQGKQLRGSWGGDSQPDRDFGRYGKLLAAGRFDPEVLLTQTYPLAGINQALDDLEAGAVPRPLIEMGLA
jgi:S-(hydroxymethyl)glutathione dehydrogenase/alcohol dehydrogenase